MLRQRTMRGEVHNREICARVSVIAHYLPKGTERRTDSRLVAPRQQGAELELTVVLRWSWRDLLVLSAKGGPTTA